MPERLAVIMLLTSGYVVRKCFPGGRQVHTFAHISWWPDLSG